jgi:hypothetical protein
MFAPFMERLLLNVDDREGPFLVIFLQLSGFFIITATKNDLIQLPNIVLVGLSLVAVFSAIYLVTLAILDSQIKLMPYYFFLFQSAFGATSLLLITDEETWYYIITFFLTNIACFSYAAYVANRINQFQKQETKLARFAALWLMTLSLFIGLPGYGLGTIIWPLAYRFITFGLMASDSSLKTYWIIISLAWVLGFLLLSSAAILSVRKFLAQKSMSITESWFIMRRSFMLGPFILALIAIAIPMVIFYAKQNGI